MVKNVGTKYSIFTASCCQTWNNKGKKYLLYNWRLTKDKSSVTFKENVRHGVTNATQNHCEIFIIISTLLLHWALSIVLPLKHFWNTIGPRGSWKVWLTPYLYMKFIANGTLLWQTTLLICPESTLYCGNSCISCVNGNVCCSTNLSLTSKCCESSTKLILLSVFCWFSAIQLLGFKGHSLTCTS